MADAVRIPELLTVRELAAATGIPRWRIHELCAQKKGPPFLRIGKTFRFAEDAVAKGIQEQSNICGTHWGGGTQSPVWGCVPSLRAGCRRQEEEG